MRAQELVFFYGGERFANAAGRPFDVDSVNDFGKDAGNCGHEPRCRARGTCRAQKTPVRKHGKYAVVVGDVGIDLHIVERLRALLVLASWRALRGPGGSRRWRCRIGVRSRRCSRGGGGELPIRRSGCPCRGRFFVCCRSRSYIVWATFSVQIKKFYNGC